MARKMRVSIIMHMRSRQVVQLNVASKSLRPERDNATDERTLTSRGGKYVSPCLILSRLSPPSKRREGGKR